MTGKGVGKQLQFIDQGTKMVARSFDNEAMKTCVCFVLLEYHGGDRMEQKRFSRHNN